MLFQDKLQVKGVFKTKKEQLLSYSSIREFYSLIL